MTDRRRTVERDRAGHAKAVENLTRARAEASAYKKELKSIADQSAQRGASDASHYKEEDNRVVRWMWNPFVLGLFQL